MPAQQQFLPGPELRAATPQTEISRLEGKKTLFILSQAAMKTQRRSAGLWRSPLRPLSGIKHKGRKAQMLGNK